MITQRADWIRASNLIQTIHLVLVFSYLISLSLGAQAASHLAAPVVCLAWFDLTVSMSYIQFGQWSSLGLYMSMLKEVMSL